MIEKKYYMKNNSGLLTVIQIPALVLTFSFFGSMYAV